ncbi:MAG: MFS transporter [Gemmataceae bacterium]
MGANGPTTPVLDDTLVRPTTMRYRVLAVACSLAVLIYVQRLVTGVVLPDLQKDLHLTTTQSGILQAAFLLAYGLFEVPCGLLGDRLGVRHLLVLLILGWSLMTGALGLVGALPHVDGLRFGFLLGVRFLFGMFQAGAFPSISRMMTDWMPMRNRALAQGLIWMSTRVGGALQLLLVGVISWAGGWQNALWMVAGLGVVWAAAFWPWFRNRPEQKSGVNSAEAALILAGRPARQAGHGHVPWARILRSRSIWCLSLMYGFGGFAANFYTTLLPKYLKDERHLTDTTMGLLSSLPFACGIVACAGGGFFSDWMIRRTGNRKWGRRLSGSVGTLLGALTWPFLNYAPNTLVLGILVCLIFFLNDLSMGPAWAACADIGERYAGTIGGAMNMIGSLMGAMGNIVAGSLFGKVFILSPPGANGSESFVLEGTNLVFLIYGCSFFIAALCWQGVDVTRTLAVKEPEDTSKGIGVALSDVD